MRDSQTRARRDEDVKPAGARHDTDAAGGIERAVLQRKIAARLQRKTSAGKDGRSDEKNAALQEGTKDIPNQDVIYEQLAHSTVKGRMDPMVLARWGYLHKEEYEDSQTGIRVVAFAPSAHLEGNPEMAESAARQQGGMPVRPVLVFRGTDNKAGVLDDMSLTGIGTYQYSHAEGEITRMLASMAGRHGAVDVVGHSLGGALAQIGAARNPGLIGRVVTFQAPGINASEAGKLAEYNARVPPDKRVGATHYRMDNDLVHQAGQAHLDGDVYKFHHQGLDTAKSHSAFPLAELNAARGGPVEGTVGGKENYDAASKRLKPGAQAVEDRLARVEHGSAGDDRGSFIRSASEAVRSGAGLLKQLGSKITGNRDVTSMEHYVRTWDEVKRMRDEGAPPVALRARIEGEKHIDADQRTQMLANLESMYGKTDGM